MDQCAFGVHQKQIWLLQFVYTHNTIAYKFCFSSQYSLFVCVFLLYYCLYFVLLRKRLRLGHSGREVVCCDDKVVGWRCKERLIRKTLLGKRESNCSTYCECVRILTTHYHNWFDIAQIYPEFVTIYYLCVFR